MPPFPHRHAPNRPAPRAGSAGPLALSLALSLAPVPAQAWGALGHQLTARVAEQALTPRTREQVRRLRPGIDLAQLSTEMDRQRALLMRRYPGSAAWHYVTRPVCALDAPPDCPGHHCLSRQILRWRAVLADPAAPAASRADALAFLVHLIGDLHQPLHAASHHDRGGNAVRVTGPGLGAMSLHRVWDVALVERAVGRTAPEDWARKAVARRRDRLAAWSTGTVDAWLDASGRLARDVVYARLPGFSCGSPMPARVEVDAAWLARGTRIVPDLIVKAGLRIAATLNAALDPPHPPPSGASRTMQRIFYSPDM